MRVGSSIAIAIALAAPAAAQTPEATATIEFDKGRTLMKQRKYKEACAAFEKSQRLDAQLGTMFNLAECQVHIGKLASAWLAYRDLGQRDAHPGRKQEAARRAKELEKRLPKLLVRIDDRVAGLAVTINGNDATSLVGVESPVDLGDYKVHATAPGFATFDATTSVVDEGHTVRMTIELAKGTSAQAHVAAVATKDPDADKDTETQDKEEPVDRPPTSHRKRNGVIAGVAGGGLVVVGAVFGLRARSSWNDAEALCPGHTCTSADDRMRGDALVDSARGDATLATAFVLGGAAITAVGVYLVVTAKTEPATSVGVAPTSGGAVFVLGGRF